MSEKLNTLIDNAILQPQDNPILNGNFAPVESEKEILDLEVIGTIPELLKGTLLRAGPNPVEPGPNHHWFTGDGMLHAISIKDGKASSYRNRWIRTEAIETKLDLKAAPQPDHKLMVQGSGNVNIIGHGGHILALSEVGYPYEMDLSLDTQSMFNYSGELASSMTAHPKVDGKTGEMLFFGYDFVAPFLRYHRANTSGELTHTVEIGLPESAMMHDFAVTESRVVFMDLPIVANFEIMAEGYTFPFQWSQAHQARLGVMDRNSTTDTVKWIDIEPCYVFHPMNSFDDGKNIVMDVVRYERAMTSDADSDYEQGGKLVRWTIDVEAGSVSSKVISDIDQEFPRVNPANECYAYRYGYALEAGGDHGFQGLLKHDLEAGTLQRHKIGNTCAGGEPVFVSTGEAEDEGFILSVIYDSVTELSELRIIDAQNFESEPVAIIKLGTRVPFGFHGNFIQS
jgi:carotenoid cleavage dioxygenase